jgi:nicotinamide riboside transporter PnuC
MTNIWWSISLSLIGIIGLHIAGRKSQWGWFIGMGAQILWIIFAIVTNQYGFILSALAYGTVNWNNWQKWRKDKRKSVTTEP